MIIIIVIIVIIVIIMIMMMTMMNAHGTFQAHQNNVIDEKVKRTDLLVSQHWTSNRPSKEQNR